MVMTMFRIFCIFVFLMVQTYENIFIQNIKKSLLNTFPKIKEKKITKTKPKNIKS